MNMMMLALPPPLAAPPPYSASAHVGTTFNVGDTEEVDDVDVGLYFGSAIPTGPAVVPVNTVSQHTQCANHSRRKEPKAGHPANEAKTMDLLDEFDKGVKKIRNWKLGDEE